MLAASSRLIPGAFITPWRIAFAVESSIFGVRSSTTSPCGFLRHFLGYGLNVRLGHSLKSVIDVCQPLHGKRDGAVQCLYHSCQSLYVATLGEVVRQTDLYRLL